MSFRYGVTVLLSMALGMQPTAANPARTSTVTERTVSGRVSRVSLGLNGGLATTGGAYGGTFLLGVTLQVDRTSPVRLGLDSGIMFGSGVGLPILLSILFKLDRHRSVQPYIGGSVGPVIGLSGTGVFAASPFTDSVKLAILVRPGLSFRVADSLDLTTEIPIGGLTGVFYVSPMVGLTTHL